MTGRKNRCWRPYLDCPEHICTCNYSFYLLFAMAIPQRDASASPIFSFSKDRVLVTGMDGTTGGRMDYGDTLGMANALIYRNEKSLKCHCSDSLHLVGCECIALDSTLETGQGRSLRLWGLWLTTLKVLSLTRLDFHMFCTIHILYTTHCRNQKSRTRTHISQRAETAAGYNRLSVGSTCPDHPATDHLHTNVSPRQAGPSLLASRSTSASGFLTMKCSESLP